MSDTDPKMPWVSTE